jgi:hypothetical protein
MQPHHDSPAEGKLEQTATPGISELAHALDFHKQGTSGQPTEALLTKGLPLAVANKILSEFIHEVQTQVNIYADVWRGP